MPRERVIQGRNPDSPGDPADESARTETLPAGSPLREFDRDDDRFDDALRPQRLEQVIGQRKVVDRVRVMLDATRKRGDTLGHLLLDGPPGIGKTTIATIIPRELGVDVQIASGPALSAPKDLLPYLTNASHNSVLFSIGKHVDAAPATPRSPLPGGRKLQWNVVMPFHERIRQRRRLFVPIFPGN